MIDIEWSFPEDLLKKIDVRLPLLVAGLSSLLLLDEYVKEGYLFNPEDILDLGSHESIITALGSVGVAGMVTFPPDWSQLPGLQFLSW